MGGAAVGVRGRSGAYLKNYASISARYLQIVFFSKISAC